MSALSFGVTIVSRSKHLLDRGHKHNPKDANREGVAPPPDANSSLVLGSSARIGLTAFGFLEHPSLPGASPPHMPFHSFVAPPRLPFSGTSGYKDMFSSVLISALVNGSLQVQVAGQVPQDEQSSDSPEAAAQVDTGGQAKAQIASTN